MMVTIAVNVVVITRLLLLFYSVAIGPSGYVCISVKEYIYILFSCILVVGAPI